ncbi:hypothetical protein DM02DRAFT_661196 [Periconia macrospinosa]|uniref:Zn(2)-C6 fungal-type domain-containing protein n=1 Tax=Periconia macrospinosa TaxID=97972 RepID=A0A2V1D9Q3_9PLEO|nr:hypothetical protein DM02DRAFT_661196 [Periconia macrospinosa]
MSSDPNMAGDGGDLSPTGSGAATNPKMRKRTKTGCLTCRKRRIKCGEERPTCANCIKSKRQCEGYNQRVVFKPPIGDWPNHPGVVSTLQYHNSNLPGSRTNSIQQAQPSPQFPDSGLASIQPRPLTQFEYAAESSTTLGHSTQPYPPGSSYQQPLQSPHHHIQTPTSATSFFPQPSPIQTSFQGQYGSNVGLREQYSQAPYTASQSTNQTFYQQQSIANPAVQESLYTPQATISSQSGGYSAQVNPMEFSLAEGYSMPTAVSHAHTSHSAYPSTQMPQNNTSDVNYMHQHAVYAEKQVAPAPSETNPEPHISLSGFGGEDHPSPTQVLDEAAVQEVDDDYYDVQSDEDMVDIPDVDEDAAILSRDFSLIRKIHFENTDAIAVRRYDSFIYDGILTHYKAEQVANPLKNPQTARVFAHFIHVTGPSLSIYERHPRNPSSIFEGTTAPAQQSLWTYTLPLKALGHQALLQAMLAMASLHIAKLQNASTTPSYKHYAFALKRLARCLGNPKKRLSVATFATSALLGFYEVMTAEHIKWNTHVVGCAQLISELGFPSLTQKARQLKAAKIEEESKLPYHNPYMLINQKQLDRILRNSAMMPDEGLISTIVGNKVSYDDFGKVFEETNRRASNSVLLDDLDLRTYETLQDIYWFYARQDAFQSIISGNPLITSYAKWADCPPRAPLGRSDALYGTHDHIILLIARIADFAVRDRTRKIKQVEADGGHWRPRPGIPGMPMGPPPNKGQGAPPPASTKPMGPPPHMKNVGGQKPRMPPGGPPGPPPKASPLPAFYGMSPSKPPIPVPKSYENAEYAPGDLPRSENAPSSDLPAAYQAALEEYNDISHAHATVARFLANTESFAPLTADLHPVAPGGNMTPFGPALLHRSYDISCMWNLLHLANIILIRAHPALPPAAHMAAGICAQATQPYATLIGRISAGMQMPATDNIPLSPFVGAALIESTMPLFFAGIQYQDTTQRTWIITRLLDINRRTGWASAAAIARGCETAWEKAAEMGRGPPYQRRKTRPVGEMGPIVLDIDEEAGKDGQHEKSVEASLSGGFAGEQRFVWGRDGKRRTVPWAKNILATEEDVRIEMEKVEI